MLTDVDKLAIFSRVLALIGGIVLAIAAFLSLKVEIDRVSVGLF
ncbi:hypothetical protein J32TS2_37070 [Shouchella clausii]|jgi:hypothetical protein|nr:hypothetical protein DB29_01863 [Shouchella clausii]GIN09988.1 hypothetical protein J1TS1_41330 [Shouchella clausii]GIN18351.1 hypothetical protein J32TS2_37070 [Shouchella clausii]SHM03970.1 hypothetical protein SAMN05192535_0076 [Shouchella rhizosphaerae]